MIFPKGYILIHCIVSLSSEKGEISFVLEQVSIDYFPGPGKPSHILFWHKNGVMIVDYSILECAYRYNQA